MLAGRCLNAVIDVNHFEAAQALSWTLGDQVYCYIQVIDPTVDTARQGFSPSGRRYMPAAASTMMVTIRSVDNNVTVTRPATQPFSQDPSIWRFQILGTDTLVGSMDLLFALTENGIVTNGRIRQGISVAGTENAFGPALTSPFQGIE